MMLIWNELHNHTKINTSRKLILEIRTGALVYHNTLLIIQICSFGLPQPRT
uniref:Uncharacterized protein n=1 Tax=Arundo donax TaxID=35708 RepID=A0A0A9STQ0_ARUDO